MATTITPVDAANLSSGTTGTIAIGKEINVFSRAVAGGSLFIVTTRGLADSDPTGVAVQFVPTTIGGLVPNAANTTISTVGAGTLTAAALAGGTVTRGGVQIAAFSDATDTATAILAALGGFGINSAIKVVVRNTTAFTETITAGAGITLSGNVLLPAQSEGVFLLTCTATGTPAFTMVGLGTHPIFQLENTVFSTQSATTGTPGVGVLAGAQVVFANFTGATPGNQLMRTPAQVLADTPGLGVGMSYELVVGNTGAGTLVLATDSGAGFTMTGNMSVPQNTVSTFAVTLLTATTGTVQFIGNTPITSLPPAKFSTINVTTGTLAAGNASGAAFVSLTSTNATPGNQAMRTVAQVLADSPGLSVGHAYMLRVTNTGAGTFTLATDGSTQFTMTGTMTVPQNTTRDFVVTINTATTGTVQAVGTGTFS